MLEIFAETLFFENMLDGAGLDAIPGFDCTCFEIRLSHPIQHTRAINWTLGTHRI